MAVTQDAAIDFSPAWSPDGNWLYFASTRGGSMAVWRVAIAEATGETLGEPQQITSGGVSEPGMLSISGDGTQLLYTETLTRRSIDVADFDPETLAITSDPVAVVEGTRRLLNPDVSSDGEWLVYRTAGAQQDIFVSRTDGTDEQQVTDDIAKDWLPRWSPDDQRITYYSDVSGSYEIWVANRDGARRMRLTNMPEETLRAPAWSPDGSQIIFSILGTGSFIIDARLSFEGQAPQPLPGVASGNGVFRGIDWSEDGLIAGQVGPAPDSGERVTVWSYNVETREYEYLAEGTGPFWMADQRRVLFAVEPVGFHVVDSLTKDIWTIDVPAAERIMLSPDNRRVYLNQLTSESDIWMLELRER